VGLLYFAMSTTDTSIFAKSVAGLHE